MSTPIRAIIVDDHLIVMEGLQRVLETDGRIQVIGRAQSLAEARALLGRLRPDLVLLDLRLSDSSGCATVVAMRALCPDARIVALTGYSQATESEALEAGADAFLDKQTASDRLVGVIMGLFRSSPPGGAVPPALTDRERDVARLAAEGLTNAEIAGVLHISPDTVKTHIGRALAKLGLSSRVDLARLWRSGAGNGAPGAGRPGG